ncbi:MAG TPA: PTS IIA-like nitrogen regulatory protein PtsN [Gammaproteobacteria bacterium]
MKIFSLLNRERVRARMEAGSKKKVLECLSGALSASLTTHTTEQIFDQLIARERLGSTGLGVGVALPHCRLAGIEAPMGALATLTDAIDYDSPDNEPVDLVFALIVPDSADEEHLQLLAQLAELFMQKEMCDQIRNAQTADEVLSLIHQWQQHAAA